MGGLGVKFNIYLRLLIDYSLSLPPMNRILSVTEYAALRGITRQAVLKRLHPIEKPLLYVVKVQKIGKTYMLEVAN